MVKRIEKGMVENVYADLEELQNKIVSKGNGIIHTTRKEGFSYVEDSSDPDVTFNGVGLDVVRDGAVTPEMFGGSVGSDCTYAIQSAVNTGEDVYFGGRGSYFISDDIDLPHHANGQKLYGVRSAVIEHTEVGGTAFKYAGNGGGSTKNMPNFDGFTIKADFGINLLDPATAIIEETGLGSTNIPLGLRPRIYRMRFECDVAAVQMAKCFDWVVDDCYVLGADVGVLAFGCDIGRVANTRLQSIGTHHIAMVGVGTFGSQNLIHHNDILSGGSDTIMILSTGNNGVIRDNFFEVGGNDVTGIFDFSSDVSKLVGLGLLTETQSGIVNDPEMAIATGNRFTGAQKVTDFVYRIQVDKLHHLEIDHVAVPVENVGDVFPLKFVSGSELDETKRIPVVINDVAARRIRLSGNKFEEWDGIDTSASKNLEVINRQTFPAYYDDISNNNADNYWGIRGVGIVCEQEATDISQPPFVILRNTGFPTSKSVTVTIIARYSGSGGAADLIYGWHDGSLSSYGSVTLNEQWGKYSYTATTNGTGGTSQGPFIHRSNTPGSDVEILKIEISW